MEAELWHLPNTIFSICYLAEFVCISHKYLLFHLEGII